MNEAPKLAEVPVLIEMSASIPGWRRWLHSIPPLSLSFIHLFKALRLRRKRPTIVGILFVLWKLACYLLALFKFGVRFFVWAVDQIRTEAQDWIDRLRPSAPSILRMETGLDPQSEACSLAIMVQYCPSGTLSEMVLHQIATYRAQGFAVVLVSNSPVFPEQAWQQARREAALVVHRRNRGLDFGAWKDLVPLALARWRTADELLLVNDSVLGPIRPVTPIFTAMRAAGPGYFGILESIQGGPHLQSWFTLARGRAAVTETAAFLAALHLSRSKWKIVQRGELQMARHMRTKGHRVAVAHSYEALVDTALAEPSERHYLDRAIPFWLNEVGASKARALLLRHPVNPAHHLWRVLTGPAGCPFLKTELVRRNPGGLPDVETWPSLVPADSPCSIEMLKGHLALLDR
jgi:hypothetical protein